MSSNLKYVNGSNFKQRSRGDGIHYFLVELSSESYPSCEESYADLEHVLVTEFSPAKYILGDEIPMVEQELLSLHACTEGAGISSPMQTAPAFKRCYVGCGWHC